MKARRTIRISILVFVAFLVAVSTIVLAQDSNPSEPARKVTHRVVPAYPELAKKVGIKGTVRLVAVVAPNGSVKLTKPVGGNPVLLKSATDAVMQWKFVAAAEETKEPVEIEFAPH